MRTMPDRLAAETWFLRRGSPPVLIAISPDLVDDLRLTLVARSRYRAAIGVEP